MSVWTGRDDTAAEGPDALRWWQCVKPWTPDAPPGVVLIGFSCDEGVRRNGGRVGAKDGPRALRAAMANMAWHQDGLVYDAGDIHCDGEDMEGAQSRLAELVASTITAGGRPLILGGGHETAWGTFQGIVKAKPKSTIGTINIDAHLDLRTAARPNSGTPFKQIADWCRANDRPFRYLCLGASVAGNTRALFEKATELSARFVPDFAFHPPECAVGTEYIHELADAVDSVYLSIDLDVLPAAVMPAVSAPASSGVPLAWVNRLMGVVLGTGKLVAADVVEFNPSFDTDGNAARVAARLAWEVAFWSARKSKESVHDRSA